LALAKTEEDEDCNMESGNENATMEQVLSIMDSKTLNSPNSSGTEKIDNVTPWQGEDLPPPNQTLAKKNHVCQRYWTHPPGTLPANPIILQTINQQLHKSPCCTCPPPLLLIDQVKARMNPAHTLTLQAPLPTTPSPYPWTKPLFSNVAFPDRTFIGTT